MCRLSLAGRTESVFQWQDGAPVIAFGKHAGRTLHALAAGPNSNYFNWLRGEDSWEHGKRIYSGAIHPRGKQLIEWIVA